MVQNITDVLSNISVDKTFSRFPEIFRPQSSVFESLNTHFIAVLAEIYQAGLPTPRLYRCWFTVRCFQQMTQYTNVEHVSSNRIVGYINNEQLNTVRQFQETAQNLQ